MSERGLAQYGLRLNAPGGGGDPGEVNWESEREMRLAERRVRLEREQFELAKAKEKMLPVSEVDAALAVTVGAFNAALNAMPGRAAAKIVARARAMVLGAVEEVLTAKQRERIEAGLNESQIDYADIEDILRAEVEQIKRTLSTCDFLKG
jgi:hypothetical protein